MPPVALSWLVASVSAADPGSEPVTVPAARSGRRAARGVERVLVHRHVAVGRRNDPASVRLIVSVVVEVSPSPSVIV